MEKHLTFNRENQDRIKALDESFGASGKSLLKPGRVLMGEGRLLKQSRKKTQPKVFFLFNDVIVYGSIVLNGRWYKNRKIIPLESVKLEDIEDKASLKNQWLIRTPRKSFFVAAPTPEEKQQWMKYIEECKDTLLQQGITASDEYAVSWMPDSASEICLICEAKFTPTNRRHHCRMCGILVCHKCCKDRTVIGHISSTKKQRVCRHCSGKKQEDVARSRGNSEEDHAAESSEDEDEVDGSQLYESSSSWLDTRMGTWAGIGAYMTMHPAQR